MARSHADTEINRDGAYELRAGNIETSQRRRHWIICRKYFSKRDVGLQIMKRERERKTRTVNVTLIEAISPHSDSMNVFEDKMNGFALI